MKKLITFPELEIIISNEKEGNGGWYGFEAGVELDDLSIEMTVKDFCNMPDGVFSGLKSWVKQNASVHIRAAIHKRDEDERVREEKRREAYKVEKEQKKLNRKVGYVYLVGADNGLYKIGKTVNITNRVTEFGIKLPVKTWLVHSFKSDQYGNAELHLHEVYAEKRSHGEWFNLSEDDVKDICGIQDNQL